MSSFLHLCGRISAVIFVCFFASGCTRYYYKPNAVNAPLFTDKEQLHVNAAGMYSGDGSGRGNSTLFDFQGAYSPIKHIGVIANYSTWSYKAIEPRPIIGHVDGKANLLEAGIGGYYAMGQKRTKLVGELYVGGGAGKLRSDVHMNARRFFIQPGIGMRTPWADVALHVRICNLKFSNLSGNGQDTNYLHQMELTDMYGWRITDKSFFFTEPCLTLRGGYKYAKLQLQVVYSTNAGAEWNFNPIRFTAGLYFSLEELPKSPWGSKRD